jgi:outer membrane lipoprotein-sorting protein
MILLSIFRVFATFGCACLLLGNLPAEPPTSNALEKWIERASRVDSAKVTFTQKRYLKSVHKPLLTTGEVLYKNPGLIRMTSGDPAKFIATLDKTGTLTIQQPLKKTAEIYSPEALEELAGGQGIAMLQGGFPKSLEAWKKQFSISETQSLEGGITKISATLQGKTNPVVQKVDFLVLADSGTLVGIHFHFRDGSRIENTFTSLKENLALKDDAFSADLAGYETSKK